MLVVRAKKGRKIEGRVDGRCNLENISASKAGLSWQQLLVTRCPWGVENVAQDKIKQLRPADRFTHVSTIDVERSKAQVGFTLHNETKTKNIKKCIEKRITIKGIIKNNNNNNNNTKPASSPDSELAQKHAVARPSAPVCD